MLLTLKSYDNPFWENGDDGRKKEKRKKEKREKVNDYSGTIVSERRRWRAHTLGPKTEVTAFPCC